MQFITRVIQYSSDGRYSRKNVAQIRRIAKHWDRQIERVVSDNVPVIRATNKQYKKAVAEEVQAQLKEMPLWRLREYGASGARTSALEKAGYSTVFDVYTVSKKRIQQVRGIGVQSANKIKRAADKVFDEIKETSLPDINSDSSATIKLLRLLCVVFLYENHVGALEESLEVHRFILQRAVKKSAPLSRWWQRPFLSKEDQAALYKYVDRMVEAIDQIISLNVVQFYNKRKRSFRDAPSEELQKYVVERKEHFIALLAWIGKRPIPAKEAPDAASHIYSIVERSVAPGNQVLYRMFDADNTLLYVGITNSLQRRLKQHSEEKPWFRRIDRIEIERFATRKEVEYAERQAIINEDPLHNIVFNQYA